MSVVNTMEVAVCDIDDEVVAAAVRETVHQALSHLVGAWHVRVSAADNTRGRWDFRVRGAFGHHVAGFLAAPHLVVEGVERQLRSFLRGVVPPLSVTQSRPVLVRRAAGGERISRQSEQQPQPSRNPYQTLPPATAERVA
jgi:hypothetical protein